MSPSSPISNDTEGGTDDDDGDRAMAAVGLRSSLLPFSCCKDAVVVELTPVSGDSVDGIRTFVCRSRKGAACSWLYSCCCCCCAETKAICSARATAAAPWM